ncbi:hypothetical protein [Streptomyces sp. PA5.6]|uniref:hypothetical protein n=1 Tax=Streptomyces sp. PA5.6 TaxID=3035651 RepID=UPI0039048810
MRGYFADELLLIMPLPDSPGLRLRGEVLREHRGPLAVAVAAQATRTDEILLDLTGVNFLSHSALDFLAILARRLTPPQHLILRAHPALCLRARITERGHDTIPALRLEESTPLPVRDTGRVSAPSRGTLDRTPQTAVVPRAQ